MNEPKNKLKVFPPLLSLKGEGFLYKPWQGRIYPPFIDPSLIEELMNTWDTTAEDLFICTPQKVGTHLTKQYVVELLRLLYPYPEQHPMLKGDIGHGTVPWPEVMVSQHGFEHFNNFLQEMQGHPRLWYSHCSAEDLPFHNIHPHTRFIFTLRDPKAAAVSQFHFYKAHPNLNVPSNLNLDEFLELFLNGPLYFGNYHQQVLGWINGCKGKIKPDQLLVLRYEDLVENKLASARSIARFLFPEKNVSENLLAEVAASTDFQTMKERLTRQPQSFHFNTATFFRSGTTNDWENHLTPEQIVLINQASERHWGSGNTECPPLSKAPIFNAGQYE